jgi:hypothetical protein
MNTIIESSESGETKPAEWSGPGFPTELNNPGWPVSLVPTGDDDVAANGVEHSAEDAKGKKIVSPTPGTSLLSNRARTEESRKVKLTLPGAAQTDLGQKSDRDDCLAGDEGLFSLPSTSSPLPTGGVKRKLSESPQVSYFTLVFFCNNIRNRTYFHKIWGVSSIVDLSSHKYLPIHCPFKEMKTYLFFPSHMANGVPKSPSFHTDFKNVNFIHVTCDWWPHGYNLHATGGHSDTICKRLAANRIQFLHALAASTVQSLQFFESTLPNQLFE